MPWLGPAQLPAKFHCFRCGLGVTERRSCSPQGGFPRWHHGTSTSAVPHSWWWGVGGGGNRQPPCPAPTRGALWAAAGGHGREELCELSALGKQLLRKQRAKSGATPRLALLLGRGGHSAAQRTRPSSSSRAVSCARHPASGFGCFTKAPPCRSDTENNFAYSPFNY